MTGMWAWGRETDELVDRWDSPWDSASRRPGHVDKLGARRRAPLGEEIRATARPGATEAGSQAVAERDGHLPLLTLSNRRRFEDNRGHADRVAEDVATVLFGIVLDGQFYDQPRIFIPFQWP